MESCSLCCTALKEEFSLQNLKVLPGVVDVMCNVLVKWSMQMVHLKSDSHHGSKPQRRCWSVHVCCCTHAVGLPLARTPSCKARVQGKLTVHFVTYICTRPRCRLRMKPRSSTSLPSASTGWSASGMTRTAASNSTRGNLLRSSNA